MTVGQKVIFYLVSLTLFLLWEVEMIVQMFRAQIGGTGTYIALALFGIGCFLYMVRFLRNAPIERD